MFLIADGSNRQFLCSLLSVVNWVAGFRVCCVQEIIYVWVAFRGNRLVKGYEKTVNLRFVGRFSCYVEFAEMTRKLPLIG